MTHAFSLLVPVLLLAAAATGCADPQGCAYLNADGSGCGAPPSLLDPSAESPAWFLDYDGPEGTGSLEGDRDSIYAVRDGDRLTLSFVAEQGVGGLVLGFVDANLGWTGADVTTDAVAWYVTMEGIDCPKGTPAVTLTHNGENYVAGTIRGTSACDDPSGATFEIEGSFEHGGPFN